jgi:hypothetical protein
MLVVVEHQVILLNLTELAVTVVVEQEFLLLVEHLLLELETQAAVVVEVQPLLQSLAQQVVQE